MYRLDGAYLGAVPCVAAVGFNDVGAARDHAQARKAWIRGAKDMAAAERRMSLSDVAAMLPAQAEPATPATKVVRLVSGNTALKPRLEADEDEQIAEDRRIGDGFRLLRFGPPGLVQPDDDGLI